jgi:hypothetical protein
MKNKPMTATEVTDRMNNPKWNKEQRKALDGWGKSQIEYALPIIKETMRILKNRGLLWKMN